MVSPFVHSLRAFTDQNKRAPHGFGGPQKEILIVAIVSCLEKEVTVVNYRASGAEHMQIATGNSVEVRGVVQPDMTIAFSDLNKFEGDFDFGTYEQMLDYYHGLCGHLTVNAC